MQVYWPGIVIGLIVGFYWGRVIKLVLKTRQQSGRAANFVPPEPLGRALRIIWYPTVGLWIVLPLVTGLRRHLPVALEPVYSQPIVIWFAVFIACLAMYGTLVCWRRMGSSWRMGIDPNEVTKLVFTGAYAYVRHPIYALSSLLMVASVAAVPSPAMMVIGLFHLIFLQWEARREEKYLVRLHGTQYGDYLGHVGRFVPKSVVAYVPAN